MVVFSSLKEANSLAILRDLYGFNGNLTVFRELYSDKKCSAKEAVKNEGFMQKVFGFSFWNFSFLMGLLSWNFA